MPEELVILLKQIKDNLKNIQEGFDKYQIGYFKQKSPEFFCLELNGEAGELANFEKKQWKGNNVEKNSFEDEAADVLIALMNYSNSRDINLADAVTKKLIKIEDKRSELKKLNKLY